MGSSSGGGYGGCGYESPMVKQELAKLDKGGEKRRSALISLRACVEQLDASTMPRFLSQISDSPGRDPHSSESRPFAISLFQDVARVHGRLLVPHIPRILATVTRSLSSSGSSSSLPNLHEACSKVVSSIARYSITPNSTTPEAESILRELCNPLLEALVGKLEPLTTGAAVCLQALLESDKWRFAPEKLSSELASRCSLALRERAGQTAAHLHLARALVRLNLVNPELGLGFLRSSKEILRASGATWQQKAAALQLVRGLMLGLDRNHLASESESIAHIVEQIRLDRMPHVRNEAAKALQTLKAVVSEDDPSARVLLASAEKLESPKRSIHRGGLWSSQESQQLISLSPPPDSPGASSSHSTSKRSSLLRAGKKSCSGSTSSSSSGGSSDACGIFSAEASIGFGLELENGGGNPEKRQSQAVENLRYHSSKRCSSSSSSEPGEEQEQQQQQQCVVSSESYQLELLETITTTTTTTATRQDLAEDLTPVTRKFSDTETPQKSGAVLTAEDFIRFTTPRRLVRSLQMLASPDADAGPGDSVNNQVLESEGKQEAAAEDDDELSGGYSSLELLEASSETGWSVRDNPIAAEPNGFDKLSSNERKAERRSWELISPVSSAEFERRSLRASSEECLEVKGRWMRCWNKTSQSIEMVLVVFVSTALLLPLLMLLIRELCSDQGGDVYGTLIPT